MSDKLWLEMIFMCVFTPLFVLILGYVNIDQVANHTNGTAVPFLLSCLSMWCAGFATRCYFEAAKIEKDNK